MRILVGAAMVAALGARAEPAVACGRFNECGDERPGVEWSTWVRLGYGTRSEPVADATRLAPAALGVRAPAPQPRGHPMWDAALGIDASLGLGRSGNVRVGAWGEVRTSSSPVVGGELILGAAPQQLDMFWYEGEGVLALRAGGNGSVVTAAVAYGYRAPWKLYGRWTGPTRYMIGVRLVAAATRSLVDPADWSATVGIEVEPVGALRFLLGIRSWY